MIIGKTTPLRSALAPGLYFIATPIGAARDITLRALDILASADVLAAEDTRTLRHLMEIHGVALGDRPLVAYHEHNNDTALPRLMRAIADGDAWKMPATIDDPVILDEITAAMKTRGMADKAKPPTG